MNMYKLLITISFLLSSITLFATADFTVGSMRNQIHIESYHITKESDEVKSEYLINAFEELNKKYFNDTAYIVIRIGLYRSFYGEKLFPDIRPYCLGYQDYQFIQFNKNDNPEKYVTKKALFITISTDSIVLKYCMNLIHYGLNHADEIMKKQKMILGMTLFNYFFDPFTYFQNNYQRIRTISSAEVNHILKTANPIVNSMLGKRYFYRYYTRNKPVINVYTQYDSIFVYEQSQKTNKIYNENPKIILPTDILTAILYDSSDCYLIIAGNKLFAYTFTNKKLTAPIDLPLADPISMEDFPRWFTLNRNNNTIILQMVSYYGEKLYNIVVDLTRSRAIIDTNSITKTYRDYISLMRSERTRYDKNGLFH